MPVKCPGQYIVDGITVILDEMCFMQNPEAWNEKVAEWLARELEGIQQMTPDHWKVVKYL
jgi:sulfur relay (sulfurtransferase) DsrC/TusE family protein